MPQPAIQIITTIFWISLTLTIYTYFLYPIILKVSSWCLNIKEKHRRVKYMNLPTVTMIISAYNEISCIEEKILNCKALDYPTDKITFLIGSDGSNDGTNEILTELQNNAFGVTIKTERQGKVAMLNDLAQKATSEIIVFSDANTIYDHDAIIQLVQHFETKSVGCAIGKLSLRDEQTTTSNCSTEGLYWRYENVIKKLESKLGIVPTINGGIFAIRTHLYQQLPCNAITEDQVLGMKIMTQGYQCRFAETARAVEAVSTISGELKRRIRISAGNFQSLLFVPRILNPFTGPVSFAFISHKFIRWMVPFLMITMMLCNIYLATYSPLFHFLLKSQIGFYLLAVVGAVMPNMAKIVKPMAICHYFVFMNFAILIGFYKFATNTQKTTWSVAKR